MRAAHGSAFWCRASTRRGQSNATASSVALREAFRLEQETLGALTCWYGRPTALSRQPPMLQRLRELLRQVELMIAKLLRSCAGGLPLVLSARCCRPPAVFHPSCSEYAEQALARLAHGAAAGLPHGGYAVAALGIRAVATRCPEDGHATAHSVVHLRLFPAHALGGLGQGGTGRSPGPPLRPRRSRCLPRQSGYLHRKRRQLPQRPNGDRVTATGETVRVTTDLLVAEIDTLGGTLKRLSCFDTKIRAIPARIWCCSGRITVRSPKRDYRRGWP